jgi:hypothetical protein
MLDHAHREAHDEHHIHKHLTNDAKTEPYGNTHHQGDLFLLMPGGPTCSKVICISSLRISDCTAMVLVTQDLDYMTLADTFVVEFTDS